MKALIKRVSAADVRVDGRIVGVIARGVLIFLGVGRLDGETHAVTLAKKSASLRIFPDADNKMNRSRLTSW